MSDRAKVHKALGQALATAQYGAVRGLMVAAGLPLGASIRALVDTLLTDAGLRWLEDNAFSLVATDVATGGGDYDTIYEVREAVRGGPDRVVACGHTIHSAITNAHEALR